MLSSVRRSARSLRAFMLVVAVLALLSADLARVTPSFAKEIDVIGTVDCGQRSGKQCDIGDTLVLLTADLSGELEPVTIDVSWIKKKLPGLDQDDEITLTVEILSDGTLRAISIVQEKKRSGTGNPGQVTGTNEDGKNPRRHPDVEAKEDQPKDNTVTPSPTPAPGALPGTLAGVVRSLGTGLPIAGATVSVAGLTATTDAAGAFSIGGLAAGVYQVTVSAPGFITLTQNITIAAGATTQLTLQLTTDFSDITFTLTWGAVPIDLDVHLSGPLGGGRFHASLVDPNPVPYASLTVQDDDGFGPEQMVIRRNPGSGSFVAGEYRFWVHNFFGTPGFNVSQGRVIVNRAASQLGTFEVTGATGDQTLPLWHVVNVQIDAAGNVTVVPIQRFTAGDSFTILSPPYGTKPPPR